MNFDNADASGDADGTTAVSSGDSADVDAGPAYDLNVVWETDDGSATLSEDSGPSA
jgi:hypothetical protein